MLKHKKTAAFNDGEILRTYWIVAPDTAVDCLKAIVRNPDVRIERG